MWFEELDWTGLDGGLPYEALCWPVVHTQPTNYEEVRNEEIRVKAYLCKNMHLRFQKTLIVYMCKCKTGTENY